jgi:tRNA-dihydrouridine synthase B
LLLAHLQEHYTLYGEVMGVRTARKHIGWYVRALPGGEAFRQEMNLIEDTTAQMTAVAGYFDTLADTMDRLPQWADPVAGSATLAAQEEVVE